MTKIIFVNYDDEKFNTVKAIRTEVFTDEQGANAGEEFDKYDSDSTFALMYENENPIGTARISKTDKGLKIGRIAIKKSCRGKGYGAKLVSAVTDKAFGLGGDEVFVDAQNYAIPFYERLGFEIIGDEIIDRGLVHTQMSIKKEIFYDKEK